MRLGLVFLLALAGCAGGVPLHVTLAHPGCTVEEDSRAQLLRLAATPGLARYVYTHEVLIDGDAIPHSHPVLTLHARHLRDDALLLSTFVHEQAHWLLEAHAAETDAAVAELTALFPDLPVGFPDGARDLRSSYEHLVVDHLEHSAMRCLVGEERASRAIAFWAGDHYRALYAIEQTRADEIEAIVARHDLSYVPCPPR